MPLVRSLSHATAMMRSGRVSITIRRAMVPPVATAIFTPYFSESSSRSFITALAAAFAILYPVSDLHLAVLVLKTVRHEEQNGIRRSSVAASRENKFVVYGDKRMLDLLAPKPGQLAHADQDRQKELDREAPELERKRDIVAQGENGDKQSEATEQHCADQCRNKGHYQRKVDRDPVKTVVRYYVEQDQDRGGDDSEKSDKGDDDPLFRTGRRLAEIGKGFLLGWFALIVHVLHSRNEPIGMDLPHTNSHARMRRWPSI